MYVFSFSLSELTTAWKTLAQSKAALRHIENRLEAAPGTGVLLDSVMDPPRKKSSKTVRCRGEGRSQQSPEKSSSRSPLRNTTQDSNVRRNNSVEFREPLASYREATPPPHPTTQLEAYGLQSVPGSSYASSPPPSDPLLSQLVYQRDTRDKQTDRDLDSTRSSAQENTEVRYLNDQPALVTLGAIGHQSHLTGESTPSTSPGSASQRLENLRRHQPDDKLEKLKERIRRQRQHLEEAAEREKLLGFLEQPIVAAVESNNARTSNMPTAKIRKVAAAPPAPIYKGFNSTETKIRTPDGKVWKEEEFHNLSREIYSDLSRQSRQQREQRADRSKERRPPKPVRKVHRAAPSSDLNAKPVISPASWREGQKLVKMVLGPVSKLSREDRPQQADGLSRTASHYRSSLDPRSESKPQTRPNSTERPSSGSQGHTKIHFTKTSTPSSADRDKAHVGVSADLLSVDIQGILDDLQMDCKTVEREERARQRSRASSSRGCRSASPTTRRPETANSADAGQKRRHYDADTVRQYISRQQEERKRRQAEEKRALREDAERRNQRLKELYRKQRQVARTAALPSEAPVSPVQRRLQETYSKLLLEEAEMSVEATQMQARPMYQPSGESDKENKRLEAPQSPSSSDRSLNDQPPPPLSRNDLDVRFAPFLQPDRLSPVVRPMTGPSSTALAPYGDHLLSQLLRMETAVAAGDVQHTQRPATAPSSRSQSKMSRIEALKATAASLSNRIESEARKLAGEGINYGTTTSVDMDTILAQRPSQANLDGGWAETAAAENNDVALRIQRILTSTGHSPYNGTALPGEDNLHTSRGQKETKGTHTNWTRPQTDVTSSILNRYGLIEEKNQADLHDSSAGSISEGPLLSEGSFSEDEVSPPHRASNHVPRAADHLEAVDYCAGQRRDYQRLSEFQREAARCPALSSPFAQHDGSKAAWEELNKGSPLSVINIFTKNLQGYVRASERNSPSAYPMHSGNGPVDTAVYEDDFLSSHSSGASGQSKGGSSSHGLCTPFRQQSPSVIFSSLRLINPAVDPMFHRYNYSPAALQQRMAAELQYLESIEESVRQLGDVERLMGVSMAQQESVSLAQMLKAKQQRHEHDLYELKIKAEREALETQLQLEENRQRVARAHIELQESLAGTQKETLEGLQEATMKMMSQQTEAARYTADAARHIKEMTESARSQIAGALVVPAVATASSITLDLEKGHLKDITHVLFPHNSPSQVSLDHRDRTKKEAVDGKWRKGGSEVQLEREAGTSSIEEEHLTAANDSLCSDNITSICTLSFPIFLPLADSTSVATEYSLKFDESMTEDEIEERSFRSLLPSEAHRRGTKEKKSHHHEESEDDGSNHNMTSVSGSQDANMAFSGGQDSFSQFTMDMVRQYMKDEEVRLQHQGSLLRLRQKALKDKTKTELAWLEHQKKRLRDKGEDDKMPPIRKKQRGLLMKLQQEQAEIKRLQEANKAARKERQLLLKQQEEIERMRNSTLRLKERLKCAGGEEPPVSSAATFPNMRHDEDVRSPSPSLSISGSETSSIMQKLKKMRSHMDEKFLTKREQQLMQRRHHAEELLQWKQRLDQEEAEVRRMEKEALAVWDRQKPRDKDMAESEKKEISNISLSPSHHQSSEPRTDSEKVTPESSIHTEAVGSQQPGSPSSVQPASVPETPLASIQTSPANYTQDFTSASQSPSRQVCMNLASLPCCILVFNTSSFCFCGEIWHWFHILTVIYHLNLPSEPISDQSDIESRIKALKEELRKRKFMAYQLKKEQKKRNKERLKAQEASLLKQLESYDNFIEKTKAELNKKPDLTPDTESQIKDSTSIAEQSSIKTPAHRYHKHKISHRGIDASFDHKLSDEDPPTVTPTPLYGSPECPTSGLRSHSSTEGLLKPSSKEAQTQMIESADEKIDSHQISDIQEELEVELSSKFEDQHSERLLKLEKENRLDSQERLSRSKHVSSSTNEDNRYSPSASLEQDKQIDSSSSDHSCSPDALSSKKEAPIKDIEASSPVADGYHDDFDSSVNSSPREEHQSSKPASSEIKVSRKDSPSGAAPQYDSQDEEVEEEMAEEQSHHSGTSGTSHQSGRLLDLQNQTEDSKCESKDIVNSSHSPPISPLQTPLSPVKDEMSGFDIGDRVLVGGVQPGTLRFKGPTSFANGFWAGVELDKSEGSNNGTYDGVVYFECDESHGIFAPPDKITHLPDKFEIYTDTTEDEDSFFDDLSDKGGHKRKADNDKSKSEGNLNSKNEQTSHKIYGSGDKKISDESANKDRSHLNSQHPISNGNTRDIILEFEDAPTTLLISDIDGIGMGKQSQNEITTLDEREDVDFQHKFTPADLSTDIGDDKREQKDRDSLDTFADKFLNNFMKDTVKQFAEIKKVKEQKIEAANQINGDLFRENVEEEAWFSSVEQKDGLPFFLPTEKEELSSPELCNRPESPVLGASGQEELAKRLAELELSRELLDELGDDQDWFDEDFGLSSRREQQRLKQKQREEEEEQVKTPPRPELPLPLPPKLPEQPAMVVPHSATEVEKMVHAATQEIWERCGLGKEGVLSLAQLPIPKPTQEYLGEEGSSQDQEALSIRSYRQAVYDLTWEMLQEIYTEEPNTDQPQWVKPHRVKSSSFHRVKTPGDITKIQEFIAAEVLKLYGLTKDQSQKTDWQKMLKFGRKKRDRVDHILVQELHEEEAQWVNYDVDELFVKMQLADSIFEALLKDTANVLTLIYDKRVKRDTLS
uniref:Centrosomal protein 350 n=1 Tax=Sparus aurata TaxID=8175 RepID=A0A671YSY9_SPAAU